ncbi:MAG: hypothetical protein AUK28_06930 [Desulfobacterales bacterium CG2_30_60_27]|nr:MAG: hypothetical protein AUK28_06930 [Desulfobacterales bacterium CG2_30_60_27]
MPFSLGLEYFFGNVTGDLQGFHHCPSLGNQAGNLLGGGQIDPLRKFFDMEVNDLFHYQFSKSGHNLKGDRLISTHFIYLS